MPKIILYGDFNALVPAYISINREKERSITAKYPVSITVPAGETHVFVSSVSKMERTFKGITNSVSDGATASNAFFDAFEDTVEGDVSLEEDECLIIHVEQVGLNTKIKNAVVPASEAGDYVDDYASMRDINDKPKKKGLFSLFS